MNYIAEYQEGDAVYYTGERLRSELVAKDGKPYRGWVHARVKNQPGAFVIFFPDTKEQDSFIIGADKLTKARPPAVKQKEQTGPVIEHMPVRKRKSEDE